MKKNLFIFLSLSVLILSTILVAVPVDVTGKWVMVIESRRGEMVREVEFLQDGEELTVIMQGREEGQTLEAKGKIIDNKLEWSMSRETQRGTMTVIYKGEVQEDTIKGEMQIGERGGINWTATRKVDK